MRVLLSFVAEQNNYATKIVDAYIFCDSYAWPKTQLNNIPLICYILSKSNTVKIVNMCILDMDIV